MAKPTSKTIIKAIQHDKDSIKWSSWEVEFAEFDGRYFLSDADYKLQMYVQKLLKERTILPEEIEQLLDLKHDVDTHDRNMEDCD